MLSAWVRIFRGEPDLALEHVARAFRLSPLDPLMSSMHAAAAYAHFLAGRYDVARSTAEKTAMIGHPDFLLANCILAASSSLTGRLEQAQRGVARALECKPDLRISNLREVMPFRRTEDVARLRRGPSQGRAAGVIAHLGSTWFNLSPTASNIDSKKIAVSSFRRPRGLSAVS